MTLPQKGYLLSCLGLLVCISAVFLMEGRYYQDNVYHGMNLFFAILWILSGIFGLLCLVYMIRCMVKKRWRVRDLVLGCLPVAATCLLLWGQEWSVVQMTLIAPFSVLSQEITWFLF